MIKDFYNTLGTESLGEFKDRGSKFLGYVFPCKDVSAFETRLSQLKKEHPKARHWCYAYRLGIEGKAYRANDDGEPSGSAGLPILGQLKSFELVNVGAIVVRYWGGTKLGVSGLINAYKMGAQLAIEQGEIIEEVESDLYQISFNYEQMGRLMNTLKQLDMNIDQKLFEAEPMVTVRIRKSKAEEALNKFKAKFLGISIEELLSKDVALGLTIKQIDQ